MADDKDPFDSATSDYITADDLSKGGPGHKNDEDRVGRLVIVWATALLKDQPGAQGKTYDAVEARYVVLDGSVNEKITEVPFEVLDGRFSATSIVSKLKHRVGGKPLLGRVDSRPSSANKKVLAYGLADPTDEDKVLARAYLAEHPVDPFI